MNKGFQLYPEQASRFAADYDLLYAFLWAVTLFFTGLIFVLIVYLALRYRRRHPDEFPRPVIESKKLEVIWTVIPFVIVMVIFFWGARLYFSAFREVKD